MVRLIDYHLVILSVSSFLLIGGGKDLSPADSANDMPKGLEILDEIEHLFIRHPAANEEQPHVITSNKDYEILDGGYRKILTATKRTQFCISNTCCFGGCAPFQLRILNLDGSEVVHVRGGQSSCTFGCDSDSKLEVYSGETMLGTIKQLTATCCCSCSTPSFEVRDAKEEVEFIIKRPCRRGGKKCARYGETEFEITQVRLVLLPNGPRNIDFPIGTINNCKFWSQIEVPAELGKYYDLNEFEVSFHSRINRLPSNLKALLLATGFLIDSQVFETSRSLLEDNESCPSLGLMSRLGYWIFLRDLGLAFLVFIIIMTTIIIVKTKL